MEQNNRLFLSVSDEDLAKLDALRGELGMNRSQYVRYLIAGQKKVMPAVIKDKKLVDVLSRIDVDLKALALKDGISPGDTLAIYCELREIKALLGQRIVIGPVDQKTGGK